MRVLFMVGLAALSGCSLLGHAGQEYSGPDDYAFTLSVGCFCIITGPLRITVQDGVVTDVEELDPADPREPYTDTVIAERSLTLPELSAIARRAERKAYTVDAEYDATYGFPTRLKVDWARNTTDDEVSYTVSDYVAL